MNDDGELPVSVQVFIVLLFVAFWIAVGLAIYYHDRGGSGAAQCETLDECYPDDYVPE